MATPKRIPRLRSQLPQCYHEGFLEKKSIKDKVSEHECVRFRVKYIEKLDLSELLSVSDDGCRDRKLDSARFTLHMKNEDIKMIPYSYLQLFTPGYKVKQYDLSCPLLSDIQAPSLEARELWKGFVLSVAKLSVPASLNLLPGQIHMMKEVIKKEKIRLQSYSSPDCHLYLPVISEMPACYYNVSRTEAELRLEKNPERGNLLLRPRKEGASFAITTREDVNGSVFKHYRVSRRPEGGFSIDIEFPIPCSTLHDVINCMEKKTNGVFKPFLIEDHYEETIKYFKANEENGELTVHDVANSHLGSPPAPPSKGVLMSNVFFRVFTYDEANEETFETSVSQATNSPLPSPPAPPPKPAKRDQRPDVDTPESIYLNDPGKCESNSSIISGLTVLVSYGFGLIDCFCYSGLPCEFSEDEGDFIGPGPPVVPRQQALAEELKLLFKKRQAIPE
ncbi:Signal-transducing adaptor protein 2 [Triplophysa tibetana]|uniref:Signal-transducing adaptor protein 2 n=1 Tax=Triplophysa tibetana TaxID=1572043 RepID=A0A5A9NZT8_9TELE|nr:Signal-transducing adaptor protein 2 [Triplophysa tibetana]